MFINEGDTMKKQEVNIDGLYQIKKEDLKRCADVAAKAFLNDKACKFLLSSKLTYESLYDYFLVIYKTIHNKMYMFAESENADGFIIIAQIENSEISVWDFIKAGGLKIIFSHGLGLLFRSLKYQENCIKIRNKIISPNTWYVFQFGVSPDKQGKGLGSKIIKPALDWLDSQKVSCYLETHKEVNVEIYTHLGFLLKSTDTLPNSNEKQFAMLHSQA